MRKIDVRLVAIFLIYIIGLMVFYFIEDKSIFINFFFLPTLLAGYAYDRKGGIAVALFSIMGTTVIAFFQFDNYIEFVRQNVLLWGCFLIIAGYITGVLTERINAAYIGTITTLAFAMESRDPYTYGHSSRVAEVSVRIAKKLGLSKREQNNLRMAGLLHDIGKFGIREDILRKRGPLTKEEYDHIKQHPLISVSILRPIRLLKNIIPYIYYHHEHFDGKGYFQKKNSEIPLGARILATADAYEAMTADRPYRKALSRETILKIFKDERGKQFDKAVVDALFKVTDDLKVNIEASRKTLLDIKHLP